MEHQGRTPLGVRLFFRKGKALLKYTGFEKQHRIMGFALIGFFNKALEISGAKNVAIHFATPIEDCKGYSVLFIAWC